MNRAGFCWHSRTIAGPRGGDGLFIDHWIAIEQRTSVGEIAVAGHRRAKACILGESVQGVGAVLDALTGPLGEKIIAGRKYIDQPGGGIGIAHG